MSASTVTPKNRDTIFERLLNSFLKGGNDHLLFRNFALGKDWSKEQMHFNYQYLSLLCNFNCDIEFYFNEYLKNSMKVDCKTKLTCEQQASLLSEQYCDWKEDGNAGDFVTFLLEQINIGTSVQWQESNW